MKYILIIILFTTFSFSVVAQETPPATLSVNDCEKELAEASQMLSKTLTDYKSLQAAKKDVDSELTTKSALLLKEASYNTELLKAVALLVSSEKRDKTFFRKLLDQLGQVLKKATEPQHLATIISIIILAKKL